MRKSTNNKILTKKQELKSRNWFIDTTNIEKSKKDEKSNLEMFFKIDNIIEKWDSREVWGIASAEIVDTTWDIVTYDAMKDAWPDYIQYGNIREMHQPRAVWTVTEHEFLDEEKAVYIKVKIIDDDVWEKIQAWVYKWFSIWARIIDAGWEIVDEEEVYVISKIMLVEISVVDRPANQNANIDGFKFISLTNDNMSKKFLEKFMSGKDKEEEKEVVKTEVTDEETTETTSDEVTEKVDVETTTETETEGTKETETETDPETSETETETDEETTSDEWTETETETDETDSETEKTVTISEKSFTSLVEQVQWISDKLEKALSFNDKLVKGLDLSFWRVIDKFDKVDEMESTLKALSTSNKSVQKDMWNVNLAKSHNKEVSLTDLFWIWGQM